MQYVLLLKAHANARYAQSIQKLASIECESLLQSVGVDAKPYMETIAGQPFLAFDSEPLDDEAWRVLSRHSMAAFAAERQGELLRPLCLKPVRYLPDDLAQVLKYKGKTNVEFTAMLLHCAKSVSKFALSQEPLTVLDPMCGRGTTVFCAMTEGDNAVGIDADEKAIAEADAYLTRFFQFHRIKHKREERSLTLPWGRQARERRFGFAPDAQAFKRGETREVRWIVGDSTQRLLKPRSCHIAVADLPYGVQHAPKEGRRMSTLEALLQSGLPVWREAVAPGGALALAFNTYTLPRETVCSLASRAGWTVLGDPPYDDFAHWVEQAVNRDVVLCFNPD